MPIVMSPLNVSAGAHSFTMCLASAVAAFGSTPCLDASPDVFT